jgi:hypothetical protein
MNNSADDDSSLEDEDVRSNCHGIRLLGILGENLVLALYFFDKEEEEEDVDEQTLHQQCTREPKWIHQQLCWESHVAVLIHENLFQRTYRMSVHSFQN